MKDDIARYTLRVDRECLKKFVYVSKTYGRSANKQLEIYMKKLVEQYEEKNGEINTDSE